MKHTFWSKLGACNFHRSVKTNPILGELARSYRGSVRIRQKELESRGVGSAKEKRLGRVSLRLEGVKEECTATQRLE